MNPGQTHHFTVDVEEYFHPTALAAVYPMDHWDGLPRRAPGVIDRVLAFLEERRATATFFILGWLAEREPMMVRRIAAAGHEIASHGWEHDLVGRLGPDGFRSSVTRSKALLEDLAGSEVIGYRAPSFSIIPGLEWAFDILLASGYRYDASLFPVTQHPTYGYPEADRFPFWIDRDEGRLLEIPSSTVRALGRNFPAAGGAYFRFMPYGLIRAGLREASRRSQPGTFYIHPWEMEDWAPERSGPWVPWFRTFGRRKRTWSRLERLFVDFRFAPIRETYRAMSSAEAADGFDSSLRTPRRADGHDRSTS